MAVQAKSKVASKLCIRCNKVLPLGKFYGNKAWSSQSYHDAWCMECAGKYCKDKDSIKQYCFDNNRRWDDSFWDSAVKKAQYQMATNPDYLNPKVADEKKLELLNAAAAKQFFSLMNMKPFYFYVDNMDGKSNVEAEEQNLPYNRKWRGYFSAEQVEALEEIYSQYEEDFVLDNVNIRDYARKVAKASLNADIAEDKMRRGQISASEYKEAQKIFDDLSKSSNFAACRRKPGESSGMGSLGEIILRLEINGALNIEGTTFPEDDVDKIIRDFRHTLKAVGVEEAL